MTFREITANVYPYLSSGSSQAEVANRQNFPFLVVLTLTGSLSSP